MNPLALPNHFPDADFEAVTTWLIIYYHGPLVSFGKKNVM
jgi:hypothetical protein